MGDIAKRFESNPLIRPEDVAPSVDGYEVACVLNPGAFRYRGRTGLVLRVAERPPETANELYVPVRDREAPGGIAVLRFAKDEIDLSDPRIFSYAGQTYLTTLSHLRLAWSEDGEHFAAEAEPLLQGEGPHETYGVEDCRVSELEGRYVLAYCAVSPGGVGVALRETMDWRAFSEPELIFPTNNKDCAVFDEKLGKRYAAFHRPSNPHFNANHIWLAFSADLRYWGDHHCVAKMRPGMWDEGRIGAGAAPIRTREGWLAIYHGANRENRYCLGALLLDLEDPRQVRARSEEPIMEPLADYEQQGFFGDVVFTNGHVVDGDTLTIYYGASDTVVCGATMSVSEILASLNV